MLTHLDDAVPNVIAWLDQLSRVAGSQDARPGQCSGMSIDTSR
jgi:hypothetical protein